ncbi:MAG: TonB-dependent receptor [Bacteroidia bacterium]|nr:TonB-dependent receptor [Bacteroidia bacterium]
MNSVKAIKYMDAGATVRLSERQKKRFEYILIGILLLGFVLASVAQTTTGTTSSTNDINFVLGSTFTPSVTAAIKLSDVPEIKDSVKKIENLKYGITSTPLFPKYQVQTVEPAKLQNEALPKLYKSLLKAGYSPLYNMPYAEYWIGSTRSRESVYGAHVKHLSSTTHLRDAGYGGYSDNVINVYGRKFYKKHTLNGDFNYERNVVHYYGYDTTLNKLKNDYTKQRYQLFEPKLQLMSHYTDSTHINHNIQLAYYNLQNLYRESENNIKLNALGSMYINKEKVGLQFVTDFYNHKQSHDTVNDLIMSLYPSWEANGKKIHLDIGPKITLDRFYGKTLFYFHPQANFHYNVYENMIIPYVSVGGGLIKNGLRSMSTENPFVDTTLHYANTNNQWNVTAGLRGNLSSKTSYDAKVNYSTFDSLNFYVINYSGTNQIYNRFKVIYDKATLLNVSGQLKYQMKEKLNFIAKGNYYLYKPKNLIRPYHRPDFDMTFSAIYNLKSKIIVRADLFIVGNQWAYTQQNIEGTNVLKPKLLNGWGDMNLEAEWRYSKMLGFFARINNIANQRYYRWERYPTQKFSFMLGLTFVPF